jgi:hypothetical protein
MKKMSIVAFLFILCSLSFAETPTPGTSAGASAPTAQCSFEFTSGTTDNFLKFCVTANGNITLFETPLGHEHIAVGKDGEGYAICDELTAVSYKDYAEFGASGNWSDPVLVSQSATAVKIARTTSDGVWTLTQTFSQDAATPSVKVTMALTNNSDLPRGALLLRYANVDADGVLTNNFDATLNSAMAWNSTASQNPFGVELRDAGHTPFLHGGFVRGVPAGPDPCHINQASPHPLTGKDGSIGEGYIFDVSPGKTQTVTVSYKGL